MKRNKVIFWVTSLVAASYLITACNDYNNENGPASANQKTYTLSELDSSGVRGTVTFMKQDEKTTKITINLTGTQTGNTHPAHIHANKASDGGPIVLDFNPVDGATGMSETVVTKLNDGTPITYEELINYNGHVNIHKSQAELAVMIAQGNIGSNATPATTPGTGNGNGGY